MKDEKEKQGSSRSSSSGDSYEALRRAMQNDGQEKKDVVDRSEKIQNFSLQIEEESVYHGPVYFSNHQEKTNAASGSSSPEKKKRISTGKKGNRVGLISVLGAGILLVSLLLSVYILSCANDILGIRSSSDLIDVTISDGATTGEIVSVLKEKDLIDHPYFCKLFLKLTKYGKTAQYVGGSYSVSRKIGLESMLNTFRVQQQKQEVKVTIPEGFTVDQIAQRLETNGVCKADAFLKAVEQSNFNYWFLNDMPKDKQRFRRLEGYLYPDTYNFFVNQQPNHVLAKMLDNYQEKVTSDLTDQAKALGYTMDQIMIIASIVEREAYNAEQMPDVSAVLHNRLKDPTQYPLLQCDSTQAYFNRYIKENVSAAEQQTYQDLYDTYAFNCRGLPAGPICNPGMDAIKAALQPQNSKYTYFCHNLKTGKMYLARTSLEHQNNLNKIKNGEG